MTSARRRPALGDVFEIATEAGLGYVQFIHDHPEHGSLVRVLPGVHASRPAELDLLIEGPTRFVVFYPIAIISRRKWATFVGSYQIPSHAQSFPLMKWGLPKFDDTLDWLLWDGEGFTKQTQELSDEEMDLPIVEVCSHPTLVERIASDWTWRSETEFELAEAVVAARESRGE